MTTRIGTPYFESYAAAVRYYSAECYHYGSTVKSVVDEKLSRKEIFIGKPVLKPGEKLLIDKTERRYIIEFIE